MSPFRNRKNRTAFQKRQTVLIHPKQRKLTTYGKTSLLVKRKLRTKEPQSANSGSVLGYCTKSEKEFFNMLFRDYKD